MAVAMGGVVSVSACAELGGVLGCGAGLLLASSLGANDTEAAALCVAGGALGYVWGQYLDEQEKLKVERSTQQALNQPIASNSPLRTSSATYSPEAAAAVAQPVQWTSDTRPDSVSGRSTVLRVDSDGSGGECRTVQQLAVVDGQEDVQDVRYCRSSPNSQWARA
jgi:surface antigen